MAESRIPTQKRSIEKRNKIIQKGFELMCDKGFHNISTPDIAKESGVSIKTIERIMAINIEHDIMRSIAREIELAVIGPVGDHTCYLDYSDDTAMERINRLLAEIEYWRKENDRKARIIDKYLDN